jgi:predicted sulfurtransferase
LSRCSVQELQVLQEIGHVVGSVTQVTSHFYSFTTHCQSLTVTKLRKNIVVFCRVGMWCRLVFCRVGMWCRL